MADPVVHLTNGVPDGGTGNVTTLGQTLVDGANATHGITTGAAVITDVAGTLQQYLRGLVKLIAAGINVAVTNANSNGSKTSANSAPVVIASDQASIPVAATGIDQYGAYKAALASATTVMGATGAVGDYLAGVIIVPGTAAAGTVGVTDGNGTTISLFAGGGTTALPSLAPFFVPLGIFATVVTTPGWRLILGANVTAIGVGKFT